MPEQVVKVARCDLVDEKWTSLFACDPLHIHFYALNEVTWPAVGSLFAFKSFEDAYEAYGKDLIIEDEKDNDKPSSSGISNRYYQ